MSSSDWVKLATIAIPALVSIGAAYWSWRSSRVSQRAELDARRLLALEERTAARKYEMYEPFIQAIGDLLTPQRKEAAEKRMLDVLTDFQVKASVWGSDEVLEAFSRWRRASQFDPPPQVAVRLMSDIILAIRRDIAWPETKATGIHTLGVRINDLDAKPETGEAFTMPLSDLMVKYGWKPPFQL